MLGVSSMALDARLHNFALVDQKYEDVLMKASVSDTIKTGSREKYIIKNIKFENIPFETVGNLQISCKKCESINVSNGDVIQIKTDIFPLPEKTYPGGYDIAGKYKFAGIAGFGSVKAEDKTPQIEIISHGGASILNNIRKWMVEAIDSHVKDGDGEAILEALFAGARSKISKEANDSLRYSGLYHILSISGMHIAIVSGFIFAIFYNILRLIPFVTLRFNIRVISFFFATIASFLYLEIAGMPVSGLRSFIMIFIAAVGLMFGKKVHAVNSVCFGGFIILLFSPHELFFASLQLSFFATLAIAAVFDEYRKQVESLNIVFKYFVAMLLSSIIASVATFPLVAYHFGTFSIAGLFTNLLAIPLISFVTTPFGILALLLSAMGIDSTILNFLWNITSASMDLMLKISNIAAAHKWSFLTTGEVTIPAMILLIAGIFLVILIRGALRLIGIIAIVAGLFFYMNHRLPDVVINKKFSVFKYEGKYYTMGKIYNDFVDSTWKGKLGVKHTFEDPKHLCKEGICYMGKVVYISKWGSFASFDEINAHCPSVVISKEPIEKDEIKCGVKTFIVQNELKENEPRLIFL